MLKFDLFKVCCLITIFIVQMLIWQACKSDALKKQYTSAVVFIDDRLWQSIGNTNFLKTQELIETDGALCVILGKAILQLEDKVKLDTALFTYLTDTFRINLKKDVDAVFKEFSLSKNLADPMGRYLSDFPTNKIPKLVPLITDFNYSLFQYEVDSVSPAIGIGMEMFMGKKDLYDQLSVNNSNFSSYVNRTFNKDHLASKIMQAMASEIVPDPASNKILDHILYEGKKLFLVREWMPDLPDSIWFEVTPKQMEWVKKNELDMWRFLLADKLLYKVSGKQVADLCQPAPFSQGMPAEAPGRAINFIGYQIIKAYVAKNNVPISSLASEENYDKILQLSQYKPR